MRTAIFTLLLAALLSGRAMALEGGDPPATLQVFNDCDEAVQVQVKDQEPVIIEPSSSHSYRIVASKTDIRATLVTTPSVSDTKKSCQLAPNKTTVARITCSTSRSNQLRMKITCDKPAVATLGRESGVLLASGGGIGFLALLAGLLGRTPRRRSGVPQTTEHPRALPVNDT